MNVSLPPELDGFVRAQVEGGRYLSESEVVGEALSLMRDRELRLLDLRREIERGIASGPVAPLDFEIVRRRARAALDRERPAR